ncbi:9470_t:CDS:2, partial [Cetraspora pellucida]
MKEFLSSRNIEPLHLPPYTPELNPQIEKNLPRTYEELRSEITKTINALNQKELKYVSTNPTGYLHLAHLRQAVIGNTLANVYQFLGYEFQNISYPLTTNLTYPGQATQDAANYLIQNKIRQDLNRCGLREKKLVYTADGASFFRTSLAGDEKDRVIIKQDADHHGFIPRLKGACQLLDYNPDRIKIVLVQTLSLLAETGQTQKFSKRFGNTITLDEVGQYLKLDQLKFFLLEKESNQPLHINTTLLQEKQEKTRLYYIQYAHARCHQIFQKAQEKKISEISSHLNLLTEKKERKILNLL